MSYERVGLEREQEQISCGDGRKAKAKALTQSSQSLRTKFREVRQERHSVVVYFTPRFG